MLVQVANGSFTVGGYEAETVNDTNGGLGPEHSSPETMSKLPYPASISLSN